MERERTKRKATKVMIDDLHGFVDELHGELNDTKCDVKLAGKAAQMAVNNEAKQHELAKSA